MTKSGIRYRDSSISRWETPRLIDGNDNKADAAPSKTEEEIRKAAYAESQRMGYQAGMEKAENEIQSRLDTFDAFIKALTEPFNDQNHQLAEHLAALAGKIAKSLVRRELRTEPEAIMVLVRDTVTALNTSKQEINIHLNPKNARIIRDIINIDTQEKSWNIIDDPLVAPSDCKVSAHDSLIDADLEARINIIITQFLGDERSENR